MSAYDFSRIGDNKYYFEHGDKKIIITTPIDIPDSKINKQQFKYTIAREIIKNLPPNFSGQPCAMKCGDTVWKITQEEKEAPSIITKLFIDAFVHDQGKHSVLHIKMEEDSSMRTPLGIIVRPENNNTVDMAEFTKSFHITSEPLSDPFTKLATIAFQQYETHFMAKDAFKLHDADCAVVMDSEKNQIQLKNKKELEDGKLEEGKILAVSKYYTFLLTEYGAEKIAYVEHKYGFRFEDMLEKGLPLTPEHIYRMNLGISNIEIQDLDQLFQKLRKVADLAASKDKEMALAPFLETLTEHFTGRELKGLLRVIKDEKGSSPALLNDLLDWVTETLQQKEKASNLSPESFTRLYSLLQIPQKLEKKVFTGKRMYEQTASAYTTAERKEYKPWIDQQELLQASFLLRDKKDWAFFNEKSVFTIVKCHLLREHPTEGYRVGAIIPAPSTEDGKARWYKVASCLNNGYGIFSYTLESACDDLSLPSIKLYRSTASDPYALDSGASMRNDFNPLNSPGYEGAFLSDSYEKSFFDSHSIPIWVVYLEEAKSKLLLSQDAFESLSAATASITKLLEKPYQNQNLRTLIRSYDFLLNDLLLESTAAEVALSNLDVLEAAILKLGEFLGDDASDDFQSKYYDLFHELKKEYIDSEQYPDAKKEKSDAERLLLMLQELKNIRKEEKYSNRINEFIEKLNANIIHPDLKAEEKFSHEILLTLAAFEKEVKELQEKNEIEEASICQKKWAEALDSYAKETNEHITKKKQNDLVIMGHSLGGACGQAQFVHHLIKRDRVVVPGRKCRVIFYDAPQINRDDNAIYKKFLIDHERIIKSQNIHFYIQNNQEAGDFFTLGGEEHLGSTSSAQERDQIDALQKYEGILRQRLVAASDPAIAQAETAHATQFAQGKEFEDYKLIRFDSYAQGRINTGKRDDIYEEMANRFWKIPQPLSLGIIDSKMAGNVSRGEKLHLLRVYLNTQMKKSRDIPYRDDNGILSVQIRQEVTVS